MKLLADYFFGPHLNGVQESPQSPTGVAWGTVDTRFDDTCLAPLLTAVSLSGSDAAGGGSAGTPAAVRAAAFTGGIDATEKMIVARGTKLGAVRLDTRASVFNGTAEGAGAPYGEAVTDLLATKSAGGTEEVSVCFDNTIYRVITAVPNTGGYTATANNQSMKFTVMGRAGSDAAADVIAGCGRADGTPQNKVYSNTLSGSTTMDASAWQSRATIGDNIVFTGFAMDGRFWSPHTNAGYYFLDGDGQRFRQQQDELPTDPNNYQGFGCQSVSFLGPGLLSPTIRGLRLIQGGSSRSVGVDLYPTNNTPVNGRYGHCGASEQWIYMPIYNTSTGDSYICAARPRQPGDPHAQPLSWYVLFELDSLESRLCISSGFKGGVTSPTVWVGRGSDLGWFKESLTRLPWADANYAFATSGTLYGTEVVAPIGSLYQPQIIMMETAGHSSTETTAIDLVMTDHRGQTQTVRCGAPITQNGRQRVTVPTGMAVSSFYVKLTQAGGGGTSSPRIKRKSLLVLGDVVNA